MDSITNWEREIIKLKQLLQMLERLHEDGAGEPAIDMVEEEIMERKMALDALVIEFPNFKLELDEIKKFYNKN